MNSQADKGPVEKPAERLITPTSFTPHQELTSRKRWRPSRRQLAIGIPLFLGLVLVAMLMLSRSVVFVTLPAGASVDVTGGVKMRLAETWLLFPGIYQVTARADGYYDLSQPVEVSRAPEQQFTLSLEKLPGRLQVTLENTDVTAQVFVDDQAVGSTGEIIGNITPGHHTVRVTSTLPAHRASPGH